MASQYSIKKQNKKERDDDLKTMITSEKSVTSGQVEEIASGIFGCLKLISAGEEVLISPTKGIETLAAASDVFNYIGPDFKSWGCDGVEHPTNKTPVQVYELIENADYRRIFGGFGQNLDRLYLTTPQIKSFVVNHADRYLREDGSAYFLFLFKVKAKNAGEKDEFFVAGVRRYSDGRRGVSVGRFGRGGVWGTEARHRVVVPQLESLEH